MSTIIIISARGEYHAERIAGLCEDRGVEVVRICSDEEAQLRDFHLSLADEARIHVRPGAGGPGFDLRAVSGIFYSYPLEDRLGAGSLQHLRGIYDFLEGCNWVNAPHRTEAAWNKMLVYQAALRTGMRVPRTLFSNGFDASSLALFESGEIVYKPLLLPFTSGDEGSFASKVDGELLLESAEQLRLCPQTFQQFIEKRAEVFVFVVGARVFAVAVDSGTLTHRVDFRQNDILNCDYRVHRLPAAVEAQCLRLVHDALGLKAANLDFALDRNGGYHLLDCNPYEKWGFLEERLGLPIAESYIEALLQPAAGEACSQQRSQGAWRKLP